MKEKLVNQIEVVYKPLNGKMNPPRFLDVSHFVEFFKFKFNPKDLRQSFDRKASVGGAVYETSLFPSLRHSSIGFK
ncbi:hypothetical protein HYU13_02145, partial [Candidatus Woesearchaeota archaeon]|nr:hypothetical protein [Candidatus Woesearchaeota archaeon]